LILRRGALFDQDLADLLLTFACQFRVSKGRLPDYSEGSFVVSPIAPPTATVGSSEASNNFAILTAAASVERLRESERFDLAPVARLFVPPEYHTLQETRRTHASSSTIDQ
jgi:hypothetical protein